MSTASIVVFAHNGVAPLRATLHALREAKGAGREVVVLADGCDEQVTIYLSREYLRRHIAGYALVRNGGEGGHCRLDRAFHLVHGDYFVRLDDGLRFAPGWLEHVVAALDADAQIGWLSLLEPPPAHRPRGRPRKPSGKPEVVERASTRCFATRRSLFVRHEYELMGEQAVDGCLFQRYLKRIRKKIAHLPGLVHDADVATQDGAATVNEDELPPHEGPTGAVQRLRQSYELGDDVLLTCMACGAAELEVLAARVKFCRAHQVAIGHLYEFRCPECHELHYRDDLQFRCPAPT